MKMVFGCIVHEHNLWLVLAAGLLCIGGSWVTARLFLRTIETTGLQKYGWYFLTSLTAAVAIWCTHFIAILGYDPGVPVAFDPVLTIASLLIAVVGSTIGFVLAGSRLARFTPALGGGVIGLAIAAMHYAGMMAYRVAGVVSWDMRYLAASIVLSVVLSAAAMQVAMRGGPQAGNAMAAILGLAIVSLHFTGMAALHVTPVAASGAFSNPEALHALALAVIGTALVIVGAGFASYLIDDSVRAESVARLHRMAMSDTLTGLPNRASFNDRLDFEKELAHERKGKFALVGIDLNRFKEINDLRGHAAGDEVLRILGRRFKGLLHEGEFVARTGGDEFAALYRMDDRGGISEFLARLETALFKPIRLDGFEVPSGASLGVAIWPDDARDKETLINNADLAMYRAKADPIRKICFYEPAMDEMLRARRALAADLRDALIRDQLSLHYQVQTVIGTGQITGYEALLRWHHPQVGDIPPAEFIPLAEENGLIIPIGEWVLRTACQKAAAWDPPYKVAVNLSAVQFLHADLPKLVMEVLADTGLPPGQLELELTESTIFADRERALRMLRQIKALGVSVALDDFGTGYSSLDTLRSFPFDRIKIDRSFCSNAVSSPQTLAIIRAVLGLGRSFGIPVLAEGIETYDQLSMLGNEGCDEGQGFLLGRPVPLDQIIESGQITCDHDDTAPILPTDVSLSGAQAMTVATHTDPGLKPGPAGSHAGGDSSVILTQLAVSVSTQGVQAPPEGPVGPVAGGGNGQ
ncbi:bifunctional diguanylate cyclase/phosphodiesterase [Acetobacter sp. TBRC 12305]|uniref:Bifunctional diguanylate cyclase/phosphodiesterase n=1 Tax=Acetobacter garciniae TaxID=2817435 RepID=A0A939KN17_9PROT|nr:bifunctional diguanylate cyclase/phosphodiesterase [Acetobacter garciniae]MBO1325165.1 bifunctional diguanylate cyclase/phosphodiesterase [Acetobacter garciniae]MBX0344864.1 bifunctional diguanylate cyclase/phosphodiesterase [Acetobacter garciniae]